MNFRLSKMGAIAALGVSLHACGVADRETNNSVADAGLASDALLNVDASFSFVDASLADADLGGEGSCTPWRMDAEAYAASGTQSELFALVLAPGATPRGLLLKIDVSNKSSTELQTLRYGHPDYTALLHHNNRLYFTDTAIAGVDVLLLDTEGGSSGNGVIAQQQQHPTLADANASAVYWGVDAGIMRQERVTNFVQRVHTFSPYDARVDWLEATDTQLIYTSNDNAYRLSLVDGLPAGEREQLIETTHPVGVFGGRFYYLVQSESSVSGDDELMSISLAGGAPRLEASGSRIDAPALRTNGELLWFSVGTEGYTIVSQDLAGNSTIRTLAGPNGGRLRWVLTDGETLAWIAGTTLSILGPSDCE